MKINFKINENKVSLSKHWVYICPIQTKGIMYFASTYPDNKTKEIFNQGIFGKYTHVTIMANTYIEAIEYITKKYISFNKCHYVYAMRLGTKISRCYSFKVELKQKEI